MRIVLASNNANKYNNSGYKVMKLNLEGQMKILHDDNLKKSTHDNKDKTCKISKSVLTEEPDVEDA